jgi:hypothetical protein
MGCPPTVNGLGAASNGAGSVGTEVGNQLGYLFGLQQTMDGSFRDHDFFYHFGFGNPMNTGLVGYLLLDKWCSYIGWADGIAGHTMLGSFQSRDPGQSEQAMFGGHIGCLKS